MPTIDSKFRQRTRTMRRKLRRGAMTAAGRSLQFALWRLAHRLPRPNAPHPVPRSFFGINCATNLEPAWDDTCLAWIQDLGVGSVRVDVTYDSHTEAAWRWVDQLHGAGLDVVLHLVQPAAAAANMHAKRERLDWEQFVTAILEPVRGKVSHAELGSTPNRQTWSGYSVSDFVTAHEIARPILNEYGIRAVGPNVSDYAPYFNAALLGAMRARGVVPHVHSDNLFVDRAAVPPERPDHRAVGRALSPLARLTLPRKLQHLASLSQWAGCEETWVTNFAWTIAPEGSRKPRYVSPERQADLLARYFLLAAASGLVQRVHWCQMLGHLRGLIDDGHTLRYEPPEDVFLRRHNHACPGDEAKRPAFAMLKRVVAAVSGSEFQRAERTSEDVTLHFTRDGAEQRIHWRVDGAGGVKFG